MLFEILFLLILCIIAIMDMKCRKIPNSMVVILLIIGLANIFTVEVPFQHIIGSIFPAIVLLAFSKRRHIGSGDIKLMIAVGLYYGYLQAAIMLICALLAVACYALLLQRLQKPEVKTVPFAPFIAAFCLLGSVFWQVWL